MTEPNEENKPKIERVDVPVDGFKPAKGFKMPEGLDGIIETIAMTEHIKSWAQSISRQCGMPKELTQSFWQGIDQMFEFLCNNDGKLIKQDLLETCGVMKRMQAELLKKVKAMADEPIVKPEETEEAKPAEEEIDWDKTLGFIEDEE